MPIVQPLIAAAHDAVRAWQIVPPRHSRRSYENTAGGGWKLGASRPFTRRERLQVKTRHALQIFPSSFRVRRALRIVIPLLPSEGLLANVLHVVEVVHRARPDAAVHIDWVLTGNEPGFRYGDVGDDVWGMMFGARDPVGAPAPLRADQPLDFAFWGTGKDYLRGAELQDHRQLYSETVSRWLTVRNQNVQTTADAILQRLRDFTVGVHRRVGNPRVANLQIDGKVPSAEHFIKAVRTITDRATNKNWRVYLATDDAYAIGVFDAAFGPRLIVQERVQRTTADGAEVHYGAPSFANAESAMVDTVVLAQCDVLVHASSSISTVAALMNPRLRLVRVRAADHPHS
jgi:hypothetical protein